MRVAVAGATGFVGRPLCQALGQAGHDVVALGRSVQDNVSRNGVLWRSVDAYRLTECERGLQDVDVLVYLVHSMMPTAGLTQARFEDMDLILADNMARAAARCGVQRILYVSGLMPDEPEISRHLESRREVEEALGGHGVPVTTLRAGLVVGPGGSSFQILERLVRRLPAMVLPRWTRQRTQPIGLNDLVQVLVGCVNTPETSGRTMDVGGPDVVTYRDLIAQTAAALGRTPMLLDVPVGSPVLSELWVTGVTGQPRQLTGPLVESLTHSMVARDRSLQLALGVPGQPLTETLNRATREAPATLQVPRTPRDDTPRVRSVQRMRLPPGRDAIWAAEQYLAWLPSALRPLTVSADGDRRSIQLGPTSLLELTWNRDRSTPDRAVLRVTGGALAAQPPRGRLEFREAAGVLLVAVHDFVPRLPWPIYKASQAQGHLAVMAAFRSWLLRQTPQVAATGR